MPCLGGFLGTLITRKSGVALRAELTPLARLGEKHAAIGAGAQLSDEAVLDAQAPHWGHPRSRQLHQPLEGCGCVLLQERSKGGEGVSLGSAESSWGGRLRAELWGQGTGVTVPREEDESQ